MAIVSMNVSTYSMALFNGMSRTLSAPVRYCNSELRQMTPINPNANHGMVILFFSLRPPAVFRRRASTNPRITSTGASIITRIILVMVAVPAIPSVSVGSIALPAPATWATSCSVLPV